MLSSITSRRHFLRLIGATSLVGLTAAIGLRDLPTSLHQVSTTQILMGTIVNFGLIHEDRKLAETALQAALNRMRSLEALMTRFDPAGHITQLNQEGRLHHAPTQLLHVLRLAQDVFELTAGAFDVTIKPLLDLYFHSQPQPTITPPTTEAIRAALAVTGCHKLTISDQSVLLKRGMGITMDGIAKGYIVDAGTQELADHGFTNTLVEAGGDLFASGTNSARLPWQVGIQSPRGNEPSPVSIFGLNGRAVATSGDYMHYLDPKHKYHHIIDPRTGQPTSGLASATVIAPHTWLADALATAVMVMGRSEGLALCERLSGVEALVVDTDLNVARTSHFPG
jgi:thiamine biosynthesis lipoprotein